MSDDRLKTHLAEHPRLIGALFLLVLLILQAQPVAAGAAFCHGP